MLQVITLLLLLLSTNVHAAIGKITEDKGSAEVERQKSKLSAQPGLGIESMDRVETANGIVGITFQDNTQVRVTEHSKLLIDDFVYDPNKKGAGKLALNVAMGTVRYASGNIAHENNKSVAINTPTASVAVRGTAFTMTVDEVGQSLIILLPNKDGTVGEIEVSTAAGQVVLNRAFQATFTSNTDTRPSRPAILNLSESAIDNMLIVKPPKEIVHQLQEQARSQKTALTFDELDKNALELKPEKPALSFSDLDINELNIDYLNNALDNYILAVFVLGYNATNQTYIFDRDTYYQITRNTTQRATVLINKDRGYDITIIQDGQTVNIQNQESTTNSIFIKQSK
jgi:penicillin-binding protein-related factor A (putative recombinase)